MLEFKQIFGLAGYERTKTLREEVFMAEQGVGYDFDSYDEKAWHIAGYDGDVLIGTARAYPLSGRCWKIGRVCVKKEYRGTYIGDLMMKTLQDKIVSEGGVEAVVSAQIGAKGFYEKEGYTASGEEYMEDGIPHILMQLDLSKPKRTCKCGVEK